MGTGEQGIIFNKVHKKQPGLFKQKRHRNMSDQLMRNPDY
jgi:hypothetical protein